MSQDSGKQKILSAQLRLLYANADLGVAISVLVATILVGFQWRVISRPVVVGWWLYMLLAAAIRFVIGHLYRKESSVAAANLDHCRTAFTIGIALTAIGWALAGILLYSPAYLLNQLFLVFVLGGMMLGASALLAPRPEAFLIFLPLTGLSVSFRMLLAGDATHLAMGLLGLVFTVATLVTTLRLYRMVTSSLRLQMENADLVEDLKSTNLKTAALNQDLEHRVKERTAALEHAAEQLRAEIKQREHAEQELLRAQKLESVGVLAGGSAHDL